jgi:hypothetical protein
MTTCLNDKLSQIDVAMRSAREREASLRGAFGGFDDGLGKHEFTIIEVLRQRVEQIGAEANQCVGQEAAFVGQTEVTTQYEMDAPSGGSSGRSTASSGEHEKSDPRIADNTPPPPQPPAGVSPSVTAGASNEEQRYTLDAPHTSSMLVYTANVTMAVFQVESAIALVQKIGESSGGYLVQKNDRLVTIRVPRDRFADAIAQVEKLGDVVHRDVSAEDVTDEYVDTEIRLKNARALRDRLEALLKNATVEESLHIESELARVTGSIEQMEGRLKLLREKIAYSIITVSFQPQDARPVHATALLPFPWLQELGLSNLLNVNP